MRALLIALVLLAGCPEDGPPNPSEPVESVSADPCDRACKNLKRRGCSGWRGSPGADEKHGTADDVSCADVCRDFELAAKQNNAPALSLKPECLAAATNCEAARACLR